VAPTEYDQIVYKAAAAIVNQSLQLDWRGLTSDDIQQAQQVLESSRAQEAWLQQATDFAKNHYISDKGWQGILSCFRQAFPICYPVLKRGDSISRETECSPSLDKLCSIIPGAYFKTPEPETPYSSAESSIERSFQRIKLEEGLKNVLPELEETEETGEPEEDQTFHFLFPRPTTFTRQDTIPSDVSTISSLGEDLEPKDIVPPLLRAKPVYSSRFNRDLNPGVTREEWKAAKEADLAEWEEEKSAHQEQLREYLHYNIPRANYGQVWQDYYGEDYPESERAVSPELPVIARPPTPQELAQPQVNMAANATEIASYLELMRNTKYDGTSDISWFIRSFEGLRTLILELNPNYNDFLIETTLRVCLQDAKPPPSVGIDGESYIGPATWYTKQPVGDVDSYAKLKQKLESKFKAKTENGSKIVSRLAQLERGDRTAKEFLVEFNETLGTVEIYDFTLIDLFTKQMPREVTKRLLTSCPDFRDKTFGEVKDLCVKIDHAVRNPDPLENGSSKKSSHGDSKAPEDHAKKRIEDELAKARRQIAEKDEQISHLLKGSKRWTSSTDALRQDESRPRGDFRPRSSIVCWNCWKPGHSAFDCRDTKRTDKERETLRQQLGVPATKLWEEQLQKHTATQRAVPERILTRKDDLEDEEFGFSSIRGGFSFTARQGNDGVLDFTKMTKELEAVGVAPAGARPRARRGDPDSLFPDPLREKPQTQLLEWFKALRPPISMQDLLKTSPTYKREFQKYFGSNEAEELEPGRTTEEGESDRPRRRIRPRVPESDTESEGEGEPPLPAEPRHRLRNRDVYTLSQEELLRELLRRLQDKLRVLEKPSLEEPTTIVKQRILAPSLRVAAYAADYWVQDILVDSGAEVSLIEMKGALLIIQASPGIELRTDKSLNIKGVAGKTRTAGYLLLDLDFGQGVKAQEIIYVLPADQDLVNCTMLLSKPFLASIEAQMDFARDYLLIPTVDGAPVVIQGH
jgi:hypothetical protein